MRVMPDPQVVISLAPNQATLLADVLGAVLLSESGKTAPFTSLADIVTLLTTAATDVEPLTSVERDLETERLTRAAIKANDRIASIAQLQLTDAVRARFPAARYVVVNVAMSPSTTFVIDVLDEEETSLVTDIGDIEDYRDSGYLFMLLARWLGLEPKEYKIDINGWLVVVPD